MFIFIFLFKIINITPHKYILQNIVFSDGRLDLTQVNYLVAMIFCRVCQCIFIFFALDGNKHFSVKN